MLQGLTIAFFALFITTFSFAQTDAKIEVVKHNHVALHVKDIAASTKFYKEVMGLEPVAVPDSLKAIFLVYANVPEWDTLILNDPLPSMQVLEIQVAKAAQQHGTDTSKPFPFLLFGKVAKGLGHIQWLDTNKTAITPTVGDDSKQFFPIENQRAQFVGFYSHHHRRIYTHHDAFMHIHYRLYAKYHAGHLDEVAFDASEPVRLLLPKN